MVSKKNWHSAASLAASPLKLRGVSLSLRHLLVLMSGARLKRRAIGNSAIAPGAIKRLAPMPKRRYAPFVILPSGLLDGS